MTRTAAREIAVRICFLLSESEGDAQEILKEFFDGEYYASLAGEDELFREYPDDQQLAYIRQLIDGIGEHNQELNAYIEKYARSWKFGRISRTALAIMKTAMYEVLYMPDVPDSAAINEAVELAKKYEEPRTVPFINGVLGSFAREEKQSEEPTL